MLKRKVATLDDFKDYSFEQVLIQSLEEKKRLEVRYWMDAPPEGSRKSEGLVHIYLLHIGNNRKFFGSDNLKEALAAYSRSSFEEEGVTASNTNTKQEERSGDRASKP